MWRRRLRFAPQFEVTSRRAAGGPTARMATFSRFSGSHTAATQWPSVAARSRHPPPPAPARAGVNGSRRGRWFRKRSRRPPVRHGTRARAAASLNFIFPDRASPSSPPSRHVPRGALQLRLVRRRLCVRRRARLRRRLGAAGRETIGGATKRIAGIALIGRKPGANAAARTRTPSSNARTSSSWSSCASPTWSPSARPA